MLSVVERFARLGVVFANAWKDRSHNHRRHARCVNDPAAFVTDNGSERSPTDEEEEPEIGPLSDLLESSILGDSR